MRNGMLSSAVKHKVLKLKRIDNSECKINLYGFPVKPLMKNEDDKKGGTVFLNHIKND